MSSPPRRTQQRLLGVIEVSDNTPSFPLEIGGLYSARLVTVFISTRTFLIENVEKISFKEIGAERLRKERIDNRSQLSKANRLL
tara:strand:- start:20 stop:271 length:252 start_codon:yes stop_codon:yes gene_type:complete